MSIWVSKTIHTYLKCIFLLLDSVLILSFHGEDRDKPLFFQYHKNKIHYGIWKDHAEKTKVTGLGVVIIVNLDRISTVLLKLENAKENAEMYY